MMDEATGEDTSRVAVDDVARLRRELERAERGLAFTHQWYASRVMKIEDLCKAHGIWGEAAAILANGSAGPEDPPTYSRQLASMQHMIDELKRRVKDAEDGLNYALHQLLTGEADQVIADRAELVRKVARAESKAEVHRLALREVAHALNNAMDETGLSAVDAALKAAKLLRERGARDDGAAFDVMNVALELMDRERDAILRHLAGPVSTLGTISHQTIERAIERIRNGDHRRELVIGGERVQEGSG